MKEDQQKGSHLVGFHLCAIVENVNGSVESRPVVAWVVGKGGKASKRGSWGQVLQRAETTLPVNR